jgi:hypothetical protein
MLTSIWRKSKQERPKGLTPLLEVLFCHTTLQDKCLYLNPAKIETPSLPRPLAQVEWEEWFSPEDSPSPPRKRKHRPQ